MHEHVDNMMTKVSQRLWVLRRIKEYLDLNNRCVLYTSLVPPLFDYGDVIWGDKNNLVLMNSLHVLQNTAAKLILDKYPRYSSTQALQELKWSTLATRSHNHRCTLIFKCIHDLIGFDFNLRKNDDTHHYKTRQRGSLYLPRAGAQIRGVWGV